MRITRNYGITRPYILSVSTLEPRKNLIALLDAYGKIGHSVKHQLVLAGMSGWKNTKLFEMIERHPAKDSIIVTGYVPAENLAPLYPGADVFVLPPSMKASGCRSWKRCSAVVLSFHQHRPRYPKWPAMRASWWTPTTLMAWHRQLSGCWGAGT